MSGAKEEREIVDRTGWPSGAWDDEPDRVEWTDEATGYPCLIVRHHFHGNLCGYVAVPPGHPLHGTPYQDVDEVSAHGDLTYSGACQGHVCHVPEPGEPDDVWWFGFDCAHAFDFLPGMEARMREIAPYLVEQPADDDNDDPLVTRYRNLSYVRQECATLAAQLAERA